MARFIPELIDFPVDGIGPQSNVNAADAAPSAGMPQGGLTDSRGAGSVAVRFDSGYIRASLIGTPARPALPRAAGVAHRYLGC